VSGAADRPGVVVRPPLLYLGSLAAGIGLDVLFPAPIPPHGLRLPIAAVLVAAGLGLLAACFRRFQAAGTNLPTWLPATALVTSGPYRFSRNPIYLALTVAYLGLAIGYGSLWLLILLAPLLIVMRHGVIAREERYLEGKFGEPYRAYRSRVRRWL